MHRMELLIKALILIMAEYKIHKRIESITLIEKVIDSTKDNNHIKTFNDENEIVNKIKEILKDAITGDLIPDDKIMVSLEIILAEKQNFIKLIEKYIFKKNPADVINIIKNELRKELKRIDAKTALSLALSRILKPNSDVDNILENTNDRLSTIKESKGLVDVSLVDEVDFENRDSVKKASQKAKDLVSGGVVFKTGWQCINDMTNGGFRKGEFITVSALKHNYKSSFLKSAFLQIIRHNKPTMVDISKKPLMLFISLEEETDNIMFFFYTYLKYSIDDIEITKKMRDSIDIDEMTDYVLSHCLEMGFNIRIMRFIPELFDFSKLFNIVERYERQGYEVQGLFIDYVKKMSKNGCNKNGPSGTDLLELFSRLRNFFSARGCMFVTPHQLSSEANGLIRSGLRGEEFLQHIADKNYYADSKQIGQEIDLELFLQKEVTKREASIYAQRGKHRIPIQTPQSS